MARDVGLSSARLIQRFGSRAGLLAAAERVADRRTMDAIFRDLDLDRDPLGALVARLAAVADRNARRLYLLSNSYLFDPGHLAARSGARDAKAREGAYLARFREVLDRAVSLGQIRIADTAGLARAVFVTWIGTYTVWAYAPSGSLARAVARDLEFLFAPFRPVRGRSRAP